MSFKEENPYPVCPCCGSYTKKGSGENIYCTCGWSMSEDGVEEYDPEDLDFWNEFFED